ncbi:MAG: hypothetical protein ABFD92_16695 [Planctomycetaceae bacterium]|nr:hypothetical protein [Planctomycetaceae bacterium]
MIVHCDRCHVPCRTGTPDPKARLLMLSEGPHGLCVNCAVTDFFKNEKYGVSLEQVMRGSDLDGPTDPAACPKALALPHVQKQFSEVLRVGCAQVSPDDIDWLEIIANWHLPFPKKKGKRS